MDYFERECVPCGTDTFLDHTDLALDFGDMLVCSRGVEHDTGLSEVMFHWNKFSVHEHG